MEENIKLDFSNVNINRIIPTLSISAVLDSMEKPFDKEGVARKTYENHFNNPQSIYYQKNVDEIIEMWEDKGSESRRYGSMLDDYIGAILTGDDKDVKLFKLDNAYDYDDRLKGLCTSFDHFYELMMRSGDVEFVDREKTIYYPIKVMHPILNQEIEYYIKGRFDALFHNKRTKKWIIIDWKSSGSIDKVPTKYTEKFLGPMFRYPALNYYRYTNQLHFYKIALLKNYLPKDTKPEDVVVMIINLPGKIVEGSNQDYMTHLAGMEYNPELMEEIFKFAITKKLLETPTIQQKNKDSEEIIIEKSDNVDNLF